MLNICKRQYWNLKWIMSEEILQLEDIIQKSDDSAKKESKARIKKKRSNVSLPRGVPKSGRTWRNPKNRFSSVIKTRGYKKANKFEKLQILKQNITRVRDLTKRIVEKKQQEIESKKERRRANLKRQEENRRKSEVVQVFKNTAKLKRMKKKLLRSIEKRDTLRNS